MAARSAYAAAGDAGGRLSRPRSRSRGDSKPTVSEIRADSWSRFWAVPFSHRLGITRSPGAGSGGRFALVAEVGERPAAALLYPYARLVSVERRPARCAAAAKAIAWQGPIGAGRPACAVEPNSAMRIAKAGGNQGMNSGSPTLKLRGSHNPPSLESRASC
jgi:hypothetical protein